MKDSSFFERSTVKIKSFAAVQYSNLLSKIDVALSQEISHFMELLQQVAQNLRKDDARKMCHNHAKKASCRSRKTASRMGNHIAGSETRRSQEVEVLQESM